MANRREVMKSGIALAAIAAATPALCRARAPFGAPSAAATIVIADRALPEAKGFIAAAAGHGYQVREFDRDAGSLWMNVIELRLRARPLSLLGLTSSTTLFYVETLARDYGARTLVRIGAAERTASRQNTGSDCGFATLLTAERVRARLPFEPLHASVGTPYARAWRIETDARFRSVLGLRAGFDTRLAGLTGAPLEHLLET